MNGLCVSSSVSKWNATKLLAHLASSRREEMPELARQLTEAVFSYGMIPSDWGESLILNLYKGKGEALDCDNHHGLKLTE